MENAKDENNKINESDKKKENLKHNKQKERNNYTIDPKNLIGKGSFGKIYAGINKTTGEEIAIKLERLDTEQPQLVYDINIYKMVLVYQKYMNVPEIKNIQY